MRWMLGMMEAGFFPGVAYYLSWYAHIPLLVIQSFAFNHSHDDLFAQLVQAL